MRILTSLFLAVILPTLTAAQSNPAPGTGGPQLKIGLGIGLASLSSGGSSASALGPVASAQFVPVRRGGFTIGFLAQPFRVQNPNRDEAFSAYHLLFGWQFGSSAPSRTYLRPALGVVHRPWTGTDVWVSSETSIALGLAVGRQTSRTSPFGVATEGFVILSGAFGLSTALIGVTVSGSFP